MKKIGKHPIEVFCYDFENKTGSCHLAIKQQYCKYIKCTCVKPRKSEPHIKVGICSLGATVNKSKKIHPVIICPQRFKEDSMFETIREKYLSNWKNVKWIQEVNIGVGGNVDYVAVEVDEYDRVKDFLCVEIQAAGTTGTPYPWVKELIELGHYTDSTKPSYGINWANEFAKTMMQQAYKKGKIVESWHRKIVFVVQDLALDYLKATSDCSKLKSYKPNYPVDFCTFNLAWKDGKEWTLVYKQIYSTTIDGINRIIGGANVNEYPTMEEFIGNIIKKGISDGVLQSNPHTISLLENIQ
ncbi:MAG: NotI family restriction endonuclease [Prevotella sp.]|uniref:NotI family restriction endonuclease n=1 Tax=Prevotella sp. TaxID=59823 RepID=UPI002A276C9E|nr:NotI family restriction endonuclease [Prevotella sp.]MDD7319010.1 NotI family restriction endonuclease [Prevotellaceae bacterium]MDY4020790.1 NotI family restriction endonuclease [Prevotella sp.]